MERPGTLFRTKEMVAGLRSRKSASVLRLTRAGMLGDLVERGITAQSKPCQGGCSGFGQVLSVVLLQGHFSCRATCASFLQLVILLRQRLSFRQSFIFNSRKMFGDIR